MLLFRRKSKMSSVKTFRLCFKCITLYYSTLKGHTMCCTKGRGTDFQIHSSSNNREQSKKAYATRHNPCFPVLQLGQLTTVLRTPHCSLILAKVDKNGALIFEFYNQTQVQNRCFNYMCLFFFFFFTVIFACHNHKVRNTTDATKKNVI